MSSGYVWQHFYQKAMIETDPSRLPVLIRAAQAAIDVRITQLRSDSDDSEEQQAIEDALTGLQVLKRESDRAES